MPLSWLKKHRPFCISNAITPINHFKSKSTVHNRNIRNSNLIDYIISESFHLPTDGIMAY